MRSKVFGLISLISVITACSNDEDACIPNSQISELVTPNVTAIVSDESSESPLTGILEAYPCESESSIFYGNYINEELTPFYGYYRVFEGHTYSEYNRVLKLPEGYYNIVYWATPQYEEPIYSTPAIVEPGITLGVDLSKLYFALRPNKDGTYMPVYDMAHAVIETHTSEDFQASLKRAVAGLKVIVKKDDNGAFGSDIAKMQILVHDIAEKINVYTAEPENMNKTVKFDLVASTDRTSMTNATVMLFPSAANPEIELVITMTDGQTQVLSKNITSTLSANTRLTLNILINEPEPEGGDVIGNFTIENWKEAFETIEFTIDN